MEAIAGVAKHLSSEPETAHPKDLGQSLSPRVLSKHSQLVSPSWGNMTLSPLGPCLCSVEFVLRSGNEIIIYHKDRKHHDLCCTHLLCNRMFHQSERSSFSHVLTSPECGILTTSGIFWWHLAEWQWEGRCHCQVVIPGTRTTQLQPLDSTASKSFHNHQRKDMSPDCCQRTFHPHYLLSSKRERL